MQKTEPFYKIVNVYAHAFFNTFSDTIEPNEYNAIEKAYETMIKNHRLMCLLQVSFFNHHTFKKKCLDKLIEQFKLPKSIFTLGVILIDKERMELLPFILKRVVFLYEKKNNIMTMHIRFSHTIDSDQRKKFTQLLHIYTKSNIRPVFSVDPSLIAGIRAQSKTVLWEYSIKKMLNTITVQVKK